jgi:hypothetical protein
VLGVISPPWSPASNSLVDRRSAERAAEVYRCGCQDSYAGHDDGPAAFAGWR